MKALLIIVLVLLYGASSANNNMGDLLKRISNNTNKKISFIETRSASFLSDSTVSKGVMAFTQSGDMVKYLQQPYQSEQRISGDMLFIKTEGEEEKTISLTAYPALAISINAIRWILSGNLAQLRENFSIELVHNLQDWRINLTPKDETLSSSIGMVSVGGYQNIILYIKMLKNNGDSVLTTFND